ncbi:hypothetical protein GW17_00023301 [Ensete ventricosum]|nr:hypothetical protein GW17_00023301 [Ensete ventricosum]
MFCVRRPAPVCVSGLDKRTLDTGYGLVKIWIPIRYDPIASLLIRSSEAEAATAARFLRSPKNHCLCSIGSEGFEGKKKTQSDTRGYRRCGTTERDMRATVRSTTSTALPRLRLRAAVSMTSAIPDLR